MGSDNGHIEAADIGLSIYMGKLELWETVCYLYLLAFQLCPSSNIILLNQLQRVQNVAARILTCTKTYDHITLVLKSQHCSGILLYIQL